MAYKQPLGALGVFAVRDLSVLDATPPPLSLTQDLKLSPISSAPATYKSPDLDTVSYFAPGGP